MLNRRTRRTLLSAAAAAAVIAVAACSSAASSSPAAPASSSATGPVAPGTPKTLSLLTLGHFPSTAGGKTARAICEQWQGLRQQYVQKITIDTAYEMNQWFSSPAWAKVQAGSLNLTDPAYGNLETALGVGLVGDDASNASAAAIDKACRDAN